MVAAGGIALLSVSGAILGCAIRRGDGGLELCVGALNLDVRGTYRHAVDSEIFGDATAQFDDPNALHSYNVSAGLGFEF